MAEVLKVTINLTHEIVCPAGWSHESDPNDVAWGRAKYEKNTQRRTIRVPNGEQIYKYKITNIKIDNSRCNRVNRETKYKFNHSKIGQFDFTKCNINVKPENVNMWYTWWTKQELLDHFKIVFYKRNLMRRNLTTLALSLREIGNYDIEKIPGDRNVDEDFYYNSITLKIPLTQIHNENTVNDENKSEGSISSNETPDNYVEILQHKENDRFNSDKLNPRISEMESRITRLEQIVLGKNSDNLPFSQPMPPARSPGSLRSSSAVMQTVGGGKKKK